MTAIDITDMGDESKDLRWVELESWHLIGETSLSGNGLWFVTTRCGINREWNQTYVDRLPGGGETACENCLVLLAGDVDEPADDDDVKPEPRKPRGRVSKDHEAEKDTP